MTENSFNTYEFIINDDDEIMLLLYSQEGSPDKPVLDVMLEENKAVLYRSKDKGIIIEDISDDVPFKYIGSALYFNSCQLPETSEYPLEEIKLSILGYTDSTNYHINKCEFDKSKYFFFLSL